MRESAKGARAAGVQVTLVEGPQMVHAYPAFAGFVPEAKEAFVQAGAFFKQHLLRSPALRGVRSMRAIVVTGLGGPEVLTPAEAPLPLPGPAEVRVALRAIGVNFAETERRRGVYARPALPWIPAALPLQGLTAWGLVHLVAKVARGQTVLLHAAAGGVGRLALQLCVRAGARVFGTGSVGKVYALEEAAEAHRALEGRGAIGKLILDPLARSQEP